MTDLSFTPRNQRLNVLSKSAGLVLVQGSWCAFPPFSLTIALPHSAWVEAQCHVNP